jgi:probable F420-dependent oxidoreductase
MFDRTATDAAREQLGPIGVALDCPDWPSVLHHAPELERQGYRTLWITGPTLSTLDRIAEVADVTRAATISTAVIPADRYCAAEVADVFARVDADHPGRLIVGVGGAHGPSPLTTLNSYFDELESFDPPIGANRRIVSALGPRMLDLARERSLGALPIFATPAYTRQARERLGPDAILAVEQVIVAHGDADVARTRARALVCALRDREGGYRRHFSRMGFGETEIADAADTLIDGLVAWGDPDTIAARISEQHTAGADHVALVPLAIRPGEFPIAECRLVAESLH